MIKKIKSIYYLKKKKHEKWLRDRFLSIVITNVILMVLLLLSTTGYFHPFFPLTINSVFLTGFLLAAFLVRVPSWFLFLATLPFWLLAGFFKLVGIGVWAERSTIYSFWALMVGMAVLLMETIREAYGKKSKSRG